MKPKFRLLLMLCIGVMATLLGARHRDAHAEVMPIWRATPGCGCVSGRQGDTVIGFHAIGPPLQEPPAIDFRQFDRIGIVGPRLDESGRLVLPAHWQRDAAAMARTAWRHNTQLDIVLGSDVGWPGLQAQPTHAVQHLVQRAAAQAVAAADLPLDGSRLTWRALALPFWGEPRHAYTGITVMFDDPSLPNGADPAASEAQHAFVLALITEMQRTGRRYALNLVLPEPWLGQDGAFGFDALMALIEQAGLPGNARVPDGADRSRYKGTSDITVSVLPVLREPVSISKKELRARVDHSATVTGHRRVALLNAMVPVIALPGGATRATTAGPRQGGLDDTLAYLSWNYGGVALWPVPIAGQGVGSDALAGLEDNFRATPTAAGGSAIGQALCAWVCPQRAPLRLLWQVLVLATAGAAALRLRAARSASGRVDWRVTLRTLGFAMVLLGAALLACDPALDALVRSGWPRNAVLALVLAAAVRVAARRHQARRSSS